MTTYTASAPTRIDLAGGTLDIWPLNLMFENPVTLNAAVTIRAHAAVTLTKKRNMRLVSEDLGKTVEFPSLDSMTHDHPLEMLSRLAEHFLIRRKQGVEIVTRSEAPAGAGLAGSSALNIALCGALAKASQTRISKDGLINVAKDVEAALLGIPTGLQDYGAAVYGAAHAFSFPPGGMRRAKIPAGAADLIEKHVLLFYSGKSRLSGINNWEMFRRVIDGEKRTLRIFRLIAECAAAAADAAMKGDMASLCAAVDAEWEARRKLFKNISTPRIDKAVTAARRQGASAARILGAGGGGCFILLAAPERHETVVKAAEAAGCHRLPFRFSKSGLKVYNTR